MREMRMNTLVNSRTQKQGKGFFSWGRNAWIKFVICITSYDRTCWYTSAFDGCPVMPTLALVDFEVARCWRPKMYMLAICRAVR